MSEKFQEFQAENESAPAFKGAEDLDMTKQRVEETGSYDGTRASAMQLTGTGEQISPEKAAENQATRAAYRE